MQQMSLLDKKGRDPTSGYHGGNKESRAAWNSLDPKRLSNLRNRVLYFIAVNPDGATCDEIESGLKLSHQTASARCTELKKCGKIIPIGLRETRSGRKAAVYKAIVQGG